MVMPLLSIKHQQSTRGLPVESMAWLAVAGGAGLWWAPYLQGAGGGQLVLQLLDALLHEVHHPPLVARILSLH